MIKKDKSVYLDYINDIETKVNALCASAESEVMRKLRVKIAAKTSLFTQKSLQDGLIPNIEWVNFKQEIDALYQELSNSINQCTVRTPQIDNSITR